LQRGRQKHTKNNDYLDSTFHSSVENKIHKFVIADYYYINSLGDTVHNIIYDSVAISVPYSWYSYSKRTTYSQLLEEYSISWLTLPIRFGYLGMNNRIVNLGFLCEITPSIAINSSGKIFLSSSNNILENDIKFITSYNLFMSCSPIIQIGKPKERLIFTITPKVQYSFLSTYINEKYKSLSIGIGLGVQYYL
jgi:hypothetical protein